MPCHNCHTGYVLYEKFFCAFLFGEGFLLEEDKISVKTHGFLFFTDRDKRPAILR
jgi:hypothetical protein